MITVDLISKIESQKTHSKISELVTQFEPEQRAGDWTKFSKGKPFMNIAFLTVVIGYLAGLTQDLAVNLGAAEIYGKLAQKDLESLLEGCLETAVKNKSDLLNKFTSTLLPGGSVPAAYLDKVKLNQYLAENGAIEALPSQSGMTNPWRGYLKPFEEIVVIPGINIRESDQLDLIQLVLDDAARLFNERVPWKHPAFEQLLLRYQERILERISALPVETVKEINKSRQDEVVEGGAVLSPVPEWVNPFSVVAADDLELTNPVHVREIRKLFIARYTDLPTIEKRYNTILEGQRGTGKTMIMKYLAFETQILEWTERKGRDAQEFLSAPESFIGVYSKLGQGVFDKTDFEAIADQSRRERIFEHRLTLQLVFDVLETMNGLYERFPPSSEQVKRLKRALNSLLRTNGTIDVCLTPKDLIQAAQDHISFVSVPQVDEHLGSVSPGGGSQPTDFNPSLTLSGQLLPFLDLLRQSCETKVPFFLMVDDFDVLEPYQQARVFKTASARELSTVCFKFGIMVLGKKVLLSGEGRTFRNSDDFDRIDLDWTEGGLHENYQNSLVDIAKARLEAADSEWDSDLSYFLPQWQRGNEILSEVKAEMEAEWLVNERPTDSKSDFISKYGSARFFQRLRKQKIRMRYAGLEYVTMVSSGIYRQFLEICKLIFDRAHDEGWKPDTGGVRAEIQDLAIREYSEEMIQQFSRTSGDAQALLRGDIEITSSHMITLIDSLCDVFYSRLHTPRGVLGSGEPEIICVAIRDDLQQCPEADTLLKIAVRESILHRFQYAPKTSGGPDLPAFMLNRRLGPRRDLSIRRMQGRIEIEATDIILAASDRVGFFRKLQGKKVDSERQTEVASPQASLPLQNPTDVSEESDQ